MTIVTCDNMSREHKDALIHNEEMKKWSDDVLFGKGGMFEFLPMYKENEQGKIVRQPPPLRLA